MAVNPVEALINRIYSDQSRNKNFDAGLGAAIENARMSMADINRSYSRGTEEAKINYDELARSLLQRRDETWNTNTDQFAGQGILKSGIFATEQGKVGEAYQKDLGSAANQRRAALEALANQRLSGYNELQGMLRGESAAATQRGEQRRREEAQRKMEAHYRKVQQEMAARAMEQQRQLLLQQKALAARSGRGGGGGGGGGYYDLASLFPGMFRPPPKPTSSSHAKTYSAKPIVKGGKQLHPRVRVM